MSLTSLRETQAAAAAAEAWRWWTGEMAAMLPDRLRPYPARRAAADIRLGKDAVEVEVVRDGAGQLFADPRRLEDLDEEGWAELAALLHGCRTRIILAPPDMFVTRLILPKAARGRLRSAVGLQLAQLSPVDPALLRWAAAAGESGPDRIEARVAMARAARIEQVQDLFEAHGIAPPPICASSPEGTIEIAPGRRMGGIVAGWLGSRPWAIAALLIATIPVTTTLGATILRAAAESRVAVLEKGASPRLRAEAEARRAEALRRDLRPLATKPGVSATIEELAARLPLTDHVRTVEQGADRSVSFTIETPDAEAAEAALRASRLLPGLEVTDVAPAANSRLAVAFRTSPR